jgi:hypothetical protein
MRAGTSRNPSAATSPCTCWGDAHQVVPYAWDNSDGSDWKIYVSDPNKPKGAYADPDVIHIDPGSNTYRWDEFPGSRTYAGGAWSGGRMFYYPFHVMSEPPVTPFQLALGIVDGLYFVAVDDGPARLKLLVGFDDLESEADALAALQATEVDRR